MLHLKTSWDSQHALDIEHIQQFFAPFRHAKLGVACVRHDGSFIVVNDQFARDVACDLEDLAGQSLLPAPDDIDYKPALARRDALFNGQIESYQVQREIRCVGKLPLLASLAVSAIEKDQRVLGAVVVLTDIKRDEKQRLELKKLSYAVENSGSAVLITDPAGRIEYLNPRFSEMTGYSQAELLGKTPSVLRSEMTADEVYRDLWKSVLSNKSWRGALINRKKDGSLYWAYQSIAPITDEKGALVNIVSVSDDISRIKEKEQQMEALAYFDPLTSLGNRRSFRDRLERLIHTPAVEGLSALLLLDLDHFKKVNDTIGHDAGDELLIAIANRLVFCTNDQCSVYRLGGDEFTVLVESAPNRQALEKLAQDVISLLAQPVTIGPQEVMVTVSLGITLIHSDGDDASGLLKNADLAMYDAKHLGRNTYSFFRPQMDIEAKRAISLELDLRHAIDHQELELVFQPLVDLKSGEIKGIEALCRWEHPIEGAISPEEFIPKAEDTGLIYSLERWVIHEACAQLRILHAAGFPNVQVFINISKRHFEGDALLETLDSALSETQLNAQLVSLEVTEGLMLRNADAVLATMKKVKQRGVRLAIDDFGTGFSSLSYLRQMPVDIVKIDRSFIQDLPNDAENMVITSTVIAMAEKLGLIPLAEGIELPEQQSFLQDNRCYMGQGYLYSHPLPMPELVRLLCRNNGQFISQTAAG
ncbi:EAL domain-containing protein [Neptunomonas sp. XY-337]|uniref:putative bifunctional diguanylate cyclase/phosphodiesterase n=1 Tax=Neptunomonas sp. XY-337 TaxID=2561897 RepID=UPI0010A9A47B|nr:EAL domain-containing protein [Neptunomonas sp. XY-337]